MRVCLTTPQGMKKTNDKVNIHGLLTCRIRCLGSTPFGFRQRGSRSTGRSDPAARSHG